jgi:hypothetical protein
MLYFSNWNFKLRLIWLPLKNQKLAKISHLWYSNSFPDQLPLQQPHLHQYLSTNGRCVILLAAERHQHAIVVGAIRLEDVL